MDNDMTDEEVVENPEEFKRLPGHDRGVVPWWPNPPEGVKPEIVEGRDEYVLYEIEPERWVGCFRSKHLEDNSSRMPDLEYRKDDLS